MIISNKHDDNYYFVLPLPNRETAGYVSPWRRRAAFHALWNDRCLEIALATVKRQNEEYFP
jgi:hypothetical protein